MLNLTPEPLRAPSLNTHKYEHVSSDPALAAPHLGLPSSALLDEAAGHGGAHRVALEEASHRVAQTQRHQLLEWTQSERIKYCDM
jgi:hypothetical protein